MKKKYKKLITNRILLTGFLLAVQAVWLMVFLKRLISYSVWINAGFTVLSILITLFLIMFRPRQETPSSPSQTASYIPGVYTSSMTLGSQNLNVEVTVGADEIRSVSFVSLDEAVTTMYPLLQPTFDSICDQVMELQSLDSISYDTESKYTSLVLLEAIQNSLDKAKTAEAE